jgi:hypothetical protein
MATLEMNVNQVNSDFQGIKTAIVDSGVEVADGTPTSELADKVNEVYNAGYEKGKLEGGNTEEAYDNGYTDGKQAEWSEFWDSFQQNGTLESHARAFATPAWNDNNFKPKYDMKPTSAYMMFSYSQITDLAQILNDCSVKLDLSRCTNISDAFSYGRIQHIPELDLRNFDVVNLGTYNTSGLHTIDKVILRDDGSQTFGTSHLAPNSVNFVNITFEGVIGDSMKLSNSKLSVDSLMSIINHLQDLIEAGKDTCTLTIGSTNLAKLTDQEKAIATQKGWTLA